MPNSISEDSPFRAGLLPETEVLLAGQDLLTGLSSRAGLDTQYRLAVARARRTGARFAVGIAVVELDPDAPPDEVFGNDLVVVEAARRLRAALRETDVLARIGETRFAFIAEEVHEPGLPAIVQRLTRALRGQRAAGGPERPLIGLALWERPEQTLPALLRSAEEDLIAAPSFGPAANDELDDPDYGTATDDVPRPSAARHIARRTLGWASLAALLALAVYAAPAQWRNGWLPVDDWLRQAWIDVQARVPGTPGDNAPRLRR